MKCEYAKESSSFDTVSEYVGEYSNNLPYLQCIKPKEDFYFFQPISEIYKD